MRARPARRRAASGIRGQSVGTANNVLYTNDLNVSYFIGVDAQETSPQMFLTGDHNMGGDANPPPTAYCYQLRQRYSPMVMRFGWAPTGPANLGPAFMANQHDKQGNIGLADGSVQGWSRSRLPRRLEEYGGHGPCARGEFQACYWSWRLPGPGCNRIQLP